MPRQLRRLHRRGTILPGLVLALLVAVVLLAFVLDRLFIDAAAGELRITAEAAALAGARALADDELLKSSPQAERIAQRAREQAELIALQNRVAGRAVDLSTMTGAVAIGRYTADNDLGGRQFVEADEEARVVRVRPQMLRSQGNPLMLLLSPPGGPTTANVGSEAEAAIDNQVTALRPPQGGTAPGMPIAIMESDPTGQVTETWSRCIDLGLGGDHYGYSTTDREVTNGPDGISEMTLTTGEAVERSQYPNVRLIDLGSSLDGERLAQQFQNGWTADDLAKWGGELPLNRRPLTLGAKSTWDMPESEAVRSLIGECRVCLLYVDPAGISSQANAPVAVCTKVVACRILSIDSTLAQGLRIVIQPGIVATRSATNESRPDDSSTESTPNRNEGAAASSRQRYIYRLSLTR